MILVDIGNTHIHIYDNGKIYNSKKIFSFNDKVYYISVNKKKEKEFLLKNKNAINLENVVKFDTAYKNLGIDRVMACKSIDDGIVVDAGSAITIDVMQEGMHLGGVIMLGISSYKSAFKEISDRLDLKTFILECGTLPNSTSEALSWGSVGSVICMIERLRKNKVVYFTGGDGEFFLRYVENSIYIKDLIFRGMIKTIKEDL